MKEMWYRIFIHLFVPNLGDNKVKNTTQTANR